MRAASGTSRPARTSIGNPIRLKIRSSARPCRRLVQACWRKHTSSSGTTLRNQPQRADVAALRRWIGGGFNTSTCWRRRAVARELVKQAGSPNSIFNTLTIIPPLVHFALPCLSEKARKHLFERLRLPDGSPPEFFRQALRSRLQTLLPTRCHRWSDDVSDVTKLYDAETNRQDAFRDEQKKAREAGCILSYDDWLDDEIPFDVPKTPYVQPPRPAVPTLRNDPDRPVWIPTPPIVRPPKPAPAPLPPRAPGLPPRFEKPAFLTAWRAAV